MFKEEGREGVKDISMDCFGRESRQHCVPCTGNQTVSAESEVLEATAQYDFTARSSREVRTAMQYFVTV